MKAFISYSRPDLPFLERLKTSLSALHGEGLIDWHDRDILAGEEIDAKIESQLDNCDLFLPLVSPHFYDSDNCRMEMNRALKRKGVGEDVRIVPIIVKKCDEWLHTALGKFKALPYDGKAIDEWANQDEAYSDIVEGLRQTLKRSNDISICGSWTTYFIEDDILIPPRRVHMENHMSEHFSAPMNLQSGIFKWRPSSSTQ